MQYQRSCSEARPPVSFSARTSLVAAYASSVQKLCSATRRTQLSTTIWYQHARDQNHASGLDPRVHLRSQV
eukprot:3332288-Rhodomonas_salina.2